jgi:hypothetical protein
MNPNTKHQIESYTSLTYDDNKRIHSMEYVSLDDCSEYGCDTDNVPSIDGWTINEGCEETDDERYGEFFVVFEDSIGSHLLRHIGVSPSYPAWKPELIFQLYCCIDRKEQFEMLRWRYYKHSKEYLKIVRVIYDDEDACGAYNSREPSFTKREMERK